MDPAYLCFMLLGCGLLFPWNCLLSAADFWELRYPVRRLPARLPTCQQACWPACCWQ